MSLNEGQESYDECYEANSRRRRGFAKGRITFSEGGPDGIGGNEEFSATGMLQSDGTLAGNLTSRTSGKLTWKAVRPVAQ